MYKIYLSYGQKVKLLSFNYVFENRLYVQKRER